MVVVVATVVVVEGVAATAVNVVIVILFLHCIALTYLLFKPHHLCLPAEDSTAAGVGDQAGETQQGDQPTVDDHLHHPQRLCGHGVIRVVQRHQIAHNFLTAPGNVDAGICHICDVVQNGHCCSEVIS